MPLNRYKKSTRTTTFKIKSDGSVVAEVGEATQYEIDNIEKHLKIVPRVGPQLASFQISAIVVGVVITVALLLIFIAMTIRKKNKPPKQQEPIYDTPPHCQYSSPNNTSASPPGNGLPIGFSPKDYTFRR